jgi:hypothetical protein
MEISGWGGGGGASCLHKTLGQQLLGTRMQPALVNIRYSYRVHVQLARQMQRGFNCIDDNALINQLLAPLDVGRSVDTAAEAHSFVTCQCCQLLAELSGQSGGKKWFD